MTPIISLLHYWLGIYYRNQIICGNATYAECIAITHLWINETAFYILCRCNCFNYISNTRKCSKETAFCPQSDNFHFFCFKKASYTVHYGRWSVQDETFWLFLMFCQDRLECSEGVFPWVKCTMRAGITVCGVFEKAEARRFSQHGLFVSYSATSWIPMCKLKAVI